MDTQISANVIQLIRQTLRTQNNKGFEKYCETLDDVPFENYDWQQMIIEELIDGLQYSVKENMRLKQELKEHGDKVDVKVFENDVWRTFNKNLNGQERMTNAVFGLTGEAGEVADTFKKVWYQGHLLNRDELLKEIGDVLYYATLITNMMDSTLDEVMTMNIMKRAKRYPKGFEQVRSVNREN